MVWKEQYKSFNAAVNSAFLLLLWCPASTYSWHSTLPLPLQKRGAQWCAPSALVSDGKKGRRLPLYLLSPLNPLPPSPHSAALQPVPHGMLVELLHHHADLASFVVHLPVSDLPFVFSGADQLGEGETCLDGF